MQDLSLYMPTRIFCSAGSLLRLAETIGLLGNRFLLVTERALSEREEVDRIRSLIEREGGEVMIFTDLPARADSRSAEAASELAKVSRLHAVIGFGGLRALGIARMTALAANSDKRVDDILSGSTVSAPPLPYIEIPGTLRSPFMCSDRFFIVDARNRTPRLVNAEGFFPFAAVIDPELSGGLSPKYRVALLLDTLLLSVEGYLSGRNTFFSETAFLKAVALAVDAVAGMEVGKVERAGLFAAQAAFFNALGTVSGSPGAGTALSWSISAHRSVPKAVASTILLPYILEYGLRSAPEKVARMGNILGENLKGLSVVAAADRTVERLRSSIGSHEFPGRLSELDLERDAFPEVVGKARELPFIADLPGPLSYDDLMQLLQQAW
ncbi:iron-containing alcohol dehydrogenase [Sediminispirochaeta smaragdinae]|jgi:1,3-propanediol dehydrogenase|uniref:Iron-containing alcohol dehydrogenase n=1 Tax=Sediminispirochaeta smaragdinae (strain DSM 11293 / JCM 15392 / SEBR 4228) TaxID=573413 RepID=E1RAI2_SEDSS|nr:iron-containing alcohol dehydrogenase [Sediminispirochaeta smaragdinae]ADK79473.1 iron-containing alcohol dehydrogenase [Sediminispirochaeta smaragdinae DSM 11293]